MHGRESDTALDSLRFRDYLFKKDEAKQITFLFTLMLPPIHPTVS